MAKTPAEMAAVGREYSHQTALMAWAAMARVVGVPMANDPLTYNQPGYIDAKRKSVPLGQQAWQPILDFTWLHSIKNQGHGDKIRGANSKAEGLRAGVFDLFLPVQADFYEWKKPFEGGSYLETRGDSWTRYSGLYIEMKTPERRNEKDGGASKEQLAFQAHARSEGFAAELAWSWEEARDLLLKYLQITPS